MIQNVKCVAYSCHRYWCTVPSLLAAFSLFVEFLGFSFGFGFSVLFETKLNLRYRRCWIDYERHFANNQLTTLTIFGKCQRLTSFMRKSEKWQGLGNDKVMLHSNWPTSRDMMLLRCDEIEKGVVNVKGDGTQSCLVILLKIVQNRTIFTSQKLH